MNPEVRWPVRAANRGYAVFPLEPGEKTPKRGLKDWEHKACSDPGRVFAHWPTQSTGYGVACGPSRLVVIDLDVPKPEKGKLMPEAWASIPGIVTGADVFAFIAEQAGVKGWPSTYTVATPTGGTHLYYRAPEASNFRNTQDVLGPMIDTRANGGYVVGGGSVTTAGTYEVIDAEDPGPLPDWLAKLLTPVPEPERPRSAPRDIPSGPGRLPALVRTVAASQPGERTSVLVWAAFRLRDMIADGHATELDGEQLVSAAVAAGIQGGEHYARGQVRSVLGRAS